MKLKGRKKASNCKEGNSESKGKIVNPEDNGKVKILGEDIDQL